MKKVVVLSVLCLILVSAAVVAQKTVLVSKDKEALYLEVGNHEFRQGNSQQAIDAFNAVLTLNPDNGQAHHNLGVVYHATNNIPQAIHHLSLAAQEETYAKAHYSLSIVYFEQGEYNKAVTHLQTVVDNEPTNPNAWFDLGVNLVAQFREKENANQLVKEDLSLLRQGLEAYHQVLELDPGFAHAKTNANIVQEVLTAYS